MKNISQFFAENLKYYRKKAKLTQKDLGRLMGYSEKAISKWESGNTIPPAETLIRLSDILQINIDSLLSYSLDPKYFLGIDGTATKTMFALSDKNGTVMRHICLGPCTPSDYGFDYTENILAEGIKEICKAIPYSEISLFAGILGGNVDSNDKIFYNFFKRFRFAKIKIGTNAENIISASLNKKDGIAVILDIESAVFSKTENKLNQYGGFGYLFDNGGGGYHFGRDAIHAALSDENGGGKNTLITELLAKINGKPSTEIITSYYKKSKTSIASFAKVVFEAYDRGDRIAENIIKNNMLEISNLIETALHDFDVSSEPIKVVFAGSLASRSDILFDYIRGQLKNKNRVHLSLYPYEPVIGAIKNAGAPINTDSDNGITVEANI